MLYCSTRNRSHCTDSLHAVLQGLAPDGGLYIPSDFAHISFDFNASITESTQQIAVRVLSALLPDFCNMELLVKNAYTGKFETEDLTPLVPVGKNYILELFRGPTSAFKDVALSMLPQLLSAAKKQLHDNGTTLILTATSGDTGKAALEGFHDVPGVRILVFYPKEGVSMIQRLQMTTQIGNNVQVCAVNGNFDDAQTGVKNAFSACMKDHLLEGKGVTLSSANSINIGRLAPQVTYYFKAYADLVRLGRIAVGDKVDFCVPTGNFGDILAGYLAKQMGLPVGMLICASNENNVLTDFLQTGCYNRIRPFHKTISPSMDILVSSNMERLLYIMTTGDDKAVAGWMTALSENGQYTVDRSIVDKIQTEFQASFCNDEATKETIRSVWEQYGYLCDPHTAVAWHAAEAFRDKVRPMVVLSTASPYKFSNAVLNALHLDCEGDEFKKMLLLQQETSIPIPSRLSQLQQLPIRHTDCIFPDALLDYVLKAAAR